LDRLKQLFSWTKENLASRCKGQEVIGVEVCGIGIIHQVQHTLKNSGLATCSKQIRVVPEENHEILAKAFFETWKDEM
jgi:hypothetical protein